MKVKIINEKIGRSTPCWRISIYLFYVIFFKRVETNKIRQWALAVHLRARNRASVGFQERSSRVLILGGRRPAGRTLGVQGTLLP